MKTITPDEFKLLCASGRPDDVKFGYPSMIYHPDDTITKVWSSPVKLLSSARLKPYARRFVENAEMLRLLGIPTPEILDYFKIEKTDIHIVRYKILPGVSIRNLLQNEPNRLDIPSLAGFILNLHERGIFFRTIHLGNIIQLPEQSYGLIDFSDISHSGSPLRVERRAVNLAVPLKYADDMALMRKAGLPDLKDAYLEVWNPSEADRNAFVTHLEKRLSRFKS